MNELNKILEKLESIETKMNRIDLSITGDPDRGVIGIKQHIATIQTDFHDHTVTDNNSFVALQKKHAEIENEITKTKSWFAGVTFAVGIISTFIFTIINILIKKK